jgi:hypothetical protein
MFYQKEVVIIENSFTQMNKIIKQNYSKNQKDCLEGLLEDKCAAKFFQVFSEHKIIKDSLNYFSDFLIIYHLISLLNQKTEIEKFLNNFKTNNFNEAYLTETYKIIALFFQRKLIELNKNKIANFDEIKNVERFNKYFAKLTDNFKKRKLSEYFKSFNENSRKDFSDFFDNYHNKIISKNSSSNTTITTMTKNFRIEDLFETKNKKLKKDGFIFNIVNNRELDPQISGLKNMKEMLCSDYDNIEFSVSATLKHKTVFEIIQQLSKDDQNDDENSKKAFVEVSEIKEKLKSIENGSFKLEKRSFSNNNEEDEEEKEIAKESLQEIEQILLDLHSLGVIIYFNDPSLKDIIVPDPEWFNKVRK